MSRRVHPLGETARALIGVSLAEIAEIPGIARSPDAQLRALCWITGPEPYFSVTMVTENSIDGVERPVWVRQENKGRKGRKPIVHLMRETGKLRTDRSVCSGRRFPQRTVLPISGVWHLVGTSGVAEIAENKFYVARVHPLDETARALIGESLAEIAGIAEIPTTSSTKISRRPSETSETFQAANRVAVAAIAKIAKAAVSTAIPTAPSSLALIALTAPTCFCSSSPSPNLSPWRGRGG